MCAFQSFVVGWILGRASQYEEFHFSDETWGPTLTRR